MKSKGIWGSPAKCEKVGSGETDNGATFGGGGEVVFAAGVGCKEEAVDKLGVGVRTTQEGLGLGDEGQVRFWGIRGWIDSDSPDTVMGGSGWAVIDGTKEGLGGGADSVLNSTRPKCYFE